MYHHSSKASILRCWAFFVVQLSHPYMTTGKTIALNPVNPKGNQSWLFIGRTEVEAETPILWPPDAKNWLLGKDPDIGKDRRQEGTTEDEMVGWHHWLDGYEFEQAPGVGDGQESLVCCSPWAHKETRLSNWTELNWEWMDLQISTELPILNSQYWTSWGYTAQNMIFFQVSLKYIYFSFY